MNSERLAGLVGHPVRSLQGMGGGDTCRASHARLADGREVFVKEMTAAPPGFFAREADGLRWLRSAHGAPVPEVLAVADDALVLAAVATGRPTVAAAERFGAALAVTHRAGAAVFGHPDRDGWISTLPLPGGPWSTWPQMWAEGRLLPYLRRAHDQHAITSGDTASVEAVLTRLGQLGGPPEPPARLHGDLWSGNVVWDDDDRGWLVDPAAHGGHRETDLAMLALFGAPHLDRILAAYDEAWPLADGWRQRVALHQMHPVLVHAVLFGGGYGAQAGRLARAVLAGTHG